MPESIVLFAVCVKDKVKMDPGFRRDDEINVWRG